MLTQSAVLTQYQSNVILFPGESAMKKDITQKDIDKAMKAFGKQVKAQSAGRRGFVQAKLEEEMAKLRPQASRLIHGKA